MSVRSVVESYESVVIQGWWPDSRRVTNVNEQEPRTLRPAPPPFSSMNSTPANSKARRTARSLAAAWTSRRLTTRRSANRLIAVAISDIREGKRLAHALGISGNHSEIGAGGPIGNRSTLLPIAEQQFGSLKFPYSCIRLKDLFRREP